MFVCRYNYSYRFIVIFHAFFFLKVFQIKIHLPDVLMLHLSNFQVNQHKAFQDAVIENKVNEMMLIVYCDF